MIATVLLVPSSPGSPLLAHALGSVPPYAEKCSCGEWYTPAIFGARRRHEAHRVATDEDAQALVLAWKGSPVPEGCDRAERALTAAEGIRYPARFSPYGRGWSLAAYGMQEDGWTLAVGSVWYLPDGGYGPVPADGSAGRITAIPGIPAPGPGALPRALALVSATRLDGVRVVLLDADGREVQP